MSSLKVQTIRDASGGNAMTVADINQTRAKHWCNFNGTGVIAARDSFNLGSLVDNGVGDYSLNMAVAMANANYALLQLIGGTATADFFRTYEDVRPRTVSQFSMVSANTSATLMDVAQIGTMTMGDT